MLSCADWGVSESFFLKLRVYRVWEGTDADCEVSFWG